MSTTETPETAELRENTEFKDFSIVLAENEFLCREDDLRIVRPGLWPSEASVEYRDQYGRVVKGKCMRAAWYRSMNYPTDGCNAGLMMKADLGKRAEAGCVERWKGMGIWVANNVKFYHHDIVASGELDAVVKHEPPGCVRARIGVEVKSFYGYNANRQICGSKRPPVAGRPKDDHFLQALVYDHRYYDILDQYRLFYLERGDGHRVEFEVGMDPHGDDFKPFWRQIDGPYWAYFNADKVYTPYMMSHVVDRYHTLIEHVRNKTLPPRDYEEFWSPEQIEIEWQRGELGKTNYDKWKKNPQTTQLGAWQCSYCDYTSHCRNDRKGESI